MNNIIEENYFHLSNCQIKKCVNIETQTEFDQFENADALDFEYINCNYDENKPNKSIQTDIVLNIDVNTQTDIFGLGLSLDFDLVQKNIRLEKDLENEKKYNQKLLAENLKLIKDFKEIMFLVNSLVKIDSSNPNIEEIKNKLVLIVNREIRMHLAFPFVNLSRYSKTIL